MPYTIYSSLLIGGLLLTAFGLIMAIKKGSIAVPKSWILMAFAGIVLGYFFLAGFLESPTSSLLGSPSQSDSVIILLLAFAIMVLFATAMQSLNRLTVVPIVVYILGGIGLILSLVAHPLFAPWLDIPLILGLTAVVAVSLIELAPATSLYKKISTISFVPSTLGLLAFGSSHLLVVVSIFSLIIALLIYMKGRRLAPWALALAILSIATIYILPIIPGKISSELNALKAVIRPNLTDSVVVAGATLGESILGVGPGLYSYAWMQHKPIEVNLSDVWAIEFGQAYNGLLTAVVSGGLLGAVLWLLFGLLVAWATWQSLRRLDLTRQISVYSVAFWLGALFLWVMYLSSQVGLIGLSLGAILTGVALAHDVLDNRNRNLTKINELWGGKLLRLCLVTALTVVTLGLYFTTNRAQAERAQVAGVNLMQQGDTPGAIAKINEAIDISKQDRYYRTLSEIYLVQLVRMVSLEVDVDNQEQAVEEFKDLYNKALENATKATELSPNNYTNWLTLGNVYEAVVNLGIEQAYERAAIAYEQAYLRNPTSPVGPFQMARLAFAVGNIEQAVTFLNKAVALKLNYAPAYLLASEIALSRGDTGTAVETSKLAVQSAPSDFLAHFQLGYYLYKNGNYAEAIDSLKLSSSYNANYANSKYLLGASMYKLGLYKDALDIFEQLARDNADNTAIVKIVRDIKSGGIPELP